MTFIVVNFVNKALSYSHWHKVSGKLSFIGQKSRYFKKHVYSIYSFHELLIFFWLIRVDICFMKNCTQILTSKERNDKIKTKGYIFLPASDIDVRETSPYFNAELKVSCHNSWFFLVNCITSKPTLYAFAEVWTSTDLYRNLLANLLAQLFGNTPHLICKKLN